MNPETNPLDWSVDERDRKVGQQIQRTQRLMGELSAAETLLKEASMARTQAEVDARAAINALPEIVRPRYWREIHEMSGLRPYSSVPELTIDFNEVD